MSKTPNKIKTIARCVPLEKGAYRVLEHSGFTQSGVGIVQYGDGTFTGEYKVTYRPNTTKVDGVAFTPLPTQAKAFQEAHRKLSGRMS